ncbi:alpha-D-xyloside xylohydrolase [Dyella sp. OK004]|uniref:TIM-barrel domain-containing protein n=1 Tax=Dyella sp. OK004 TaxID=1855292 RepID=UPI0008EC5EF5|nr:TIM-barrel domain-containing protein [Dyella sp. OK004]SFS19015.1 alpha-D-xyloside xylohydrolase [Dyella sp. OK004]
MIHPTLKCFPLCAVALAVLAGCGKSPSTEGAAAGSHAQKLDDGVIVRLDGSPQKVRLQLVDERIVHVTATPDGNFDLPFSLMALKSGGDTRFTFSESADAVTLKTAKLSAQVSLRDGAVHFFDAAGKPVLAERAGGRSFEPTMVDGKPFYAIRQRFDSPDDEAFYGLGQHQNRQMNYKGEDVELAQHNIDVGIPFVVSSRNYGLLWDNNSITRFGDPREYQPLSQSLKVYDAEGKQGGLTASYYVGDALKLKRVETQPDYQYIKDLKQWPAESPAKTTSKVVWEGSIEPTVSGEHKFRLYSSSYAKVFLDGKPVYDDWRQNWNPWYHNLRLPMEAGSRHSLRIEWEPDSGYLTLLHLDPLTGGEQSELSLFSELGHAVDYYFVAGDNLDQVIAGYRAITGKAIMLPRWAYGFWQSRERYKTQAEILDTAKRYRELGLPIDNIVEDWSYWPEAAWGSHDFDAARFPNPKGMLDQLHAMHMQLMISVWPKFYPTTKNYQELDAKGYIYRRNVEQGELDWIGKGYLNSFYDPYAKEARQIYWRQIHDKLGVLGMDGWWLDASEPDIHSNVDIAERKLRMGPTALGPGAAFFNSYPLMHTTGVYEGSRENNPDRRVFILTRSAFAGQQRNAAATWSGDVVSRWSNLHDQISAGINFSMSGIPNWTTDIGGFALEKRYETATPTAADLAEWRELNLRWFQFGTFSPLFRSHGQLPYREIYNLASPGTPLYEALAYYDRLRYRLMPYIYTLAGDTYWKDGSIMRGLPMDFPGDANVHNINDEYLFGPAFLVAPVTEYRATSRQVYLPAGTAWYDFHSGHRYDGGTTITADAPPERMPLFVRAGAIVPTGLAIQYTGQQPDAPITLLIYSGGNGQFSLYEDEGTNYGYEKGHYSRIPLSYDESSSTLTLGKREGDGSGAPAKRKFVIRWIEGGKPNADGNDASGDINVEYDGAEQKVALKTK